MRTVDVTVTLLAVTEKLVLVSLHGDRGSAVWLRRDAIWIARAFVAEVAALVAYVASLTV